jgi:hypothetical protein
MNPKSIPVAPWNQLVEEMQASPVKRLFCNSSCTEDGGDILIRGLWTHGTTDCIIDVHITDVNAKSNWSKDPI